MGDNKVAHASGKKYPDGKDIRIDSLDNALKYSFANGKFGRPKDLIDADEKAAAVSGNVEMINGKISINGKEYETLATIKGAVCTPYNAGSFMGGGGDYSRTGQSYVDIRTNSTIKVPKEGTGRSQLRYCASHNLPYGTQVYVPDIQKKGIGDGIFMVVDTGGHVFDFDFNMDNTSLNKFGGKQNMDVYVLK